MRNRFMGAVLSLCAFVLMCGGCYDTMFRLAPIADAKVDRSLCGDWLLRSSSGSEIRLSVRNLDDQSYAVAWRSIDSDVSLRRVIEENLDNNDLYDDKPFTGTRVSREEP